MSNIEIATDIKEKRERLTTKYSNSKFIVNGEENKCFSDNTTFMVRLEGIIVGVLARLHDNRNRRLFIFTPLIKPEILVSKSLEASTLPIKPFPSELACLNDTNNFVPITECEYLLYSGSSGDDIIETFECMGIDMVKWSISDFKRNIVKRTRVQNIKTITSHSLVKGKYEILVDGNKNYGTLTISDSSTISLKQSLLRLSAISNFIPELLPLKIKQSELVLLTPEIEG